MNPDTIEALIAKGRDNYEARLAAGQARRAIGDLDRAIEHFRAATAFEPGHTAAWQELGRAHRENGQDDEARRAWSQGLDTSRTNGDKQSEKVLSVWLRRLDRSR